MAWCWPIGVHDPRLVGLLQPFYAMVVCVEARMVLSSLLHPRCDMGLRVDRAAAAVHLCPSTGSAYRERQNKKTDGNTQRLETTQLRWTGTSGIRKSLNSLLGIRVVTVLAMAWLVQPVEK